MNTRVFLLLTLSACVSGHSLFAEAEQPGDFEAIEWMRNAPEDGFDFSWTGKPDRYYFVEQSPDLSSGSWSFFDYATKGDGGEAGFFLSRTYDKHFYRLRYTDDTAHPLLLEDFNQNGLTNRDELDIGANPFDDTDSNNNGVPDHIEAFWAQVPEAWKLAIVNDPNAIYYDPDSHIDSIEKVLPGGDYDGDGRSNLGEYLDGTDPTDFFNGEPAIIRALAGDAQTAVPSSLLNSYLSVSVADSTGAEIAGAPVRFVVDDGHNGLAAKFNDASRSSELVIVSSISGSFVAFETGSSLSNNPSLITASIPNGQSLQFAAYTVSAEAKARQGIEAFNEIDNQDGTTTYTWTAGPAPGDFFKLQQRRTDGTWEVFYETTYGSEDLLLEEGQTNFSLTIVK